MDKFVQVHREATNFLEGPDLRTPSFEYKLVGGRLHVRITSADDMIHVAELIVTLSEYAGKRVSEGDLALRLIDSAMKSSIVDITPELPSALQDAFADLHGYYRKYNEQVGEKGIPECDSMVSEGKISAVKWLSSFSDKFRRAERGQIVVMSKNCHWLVDLLLSGTRPMESVEGTKMESSLRGHGPHEVIPASAVRVGDVAVFVSGTILRPDGEGDVIPAGGVIHSAVIIRVSRLDESDIQVLEKRDPRRPMDTRTVAAILAHYQAERARVVYLRPHSG